MGPCACPETHLVAGKWPDHSARPLLGSAGRLPAPNPTPPPVMSSWRRDSLRASSSAPLPVVIIGECHPWQGRGCPGALRTPRSGVSS